MRVVSAPAIGGRRARALTRAISSANGERLHQIVVAPRLQTLDTVVDTPERRQQENGCRDARAANGLHQAKAVEAGQHSVDNHDVEFLPGRQKQTVATIVGDFDNMPLLTQAFGQILRGLPIVLDDEYSHTPPGPNKAGPTFRAIAGGSWLRSQIEQLLS